MIHYNNLYITEDGKSLVIDVAIDNDNYFQDVYLDSIAIDTQDTYTSNTPSNKAFVLSVRKDIVTKYPNSIIESGDAIVDTDKIKSLKITLDTTDIGIDLKKNLLFVYTTSTGTPAPDTPCGCDVSTIVKPVINNFELYKSIIPYIEEISTSCSEPLGFINRELQIKAIEYAIKSNNYLLAIRYWNKYFINNISTTIKSCNCNGTA